MEGKVIQTILPAEDSHYRLLPCPDCPGGVAVYEKLQTPAGDRWRVRCTNCGASTDPNPYTVRHTVQLAWNRRAKNEK